MGSFPIINPQQCYSDLPSSPGVPRDEVSLFTPVEVSWRDACGGQGLLESKLLRQQGEQLLTALEKTSAFNNDGEDSSVSNLFAKSKWNLPLLTCCYFIHTFKMSTHLKKNTNVMSFQD